MKKKASRLEKGRGIYMPGNKVSGKLPLREFQIGK
jgi:hypothetical protein